MSGLYQGKKMILAWDHGDGIKGHEVVLTTQDPILVDLLSNYTTGSEYKSVDRLVGRYVEFTFEIIMRGVTAPDGSTFAIWHKLMLAAAFDFAATGGGSDTHTYTAGSTAFATDDVAGACTPLDMYLWTDRRKWLTLTNCVMEITFNFASSNFPMMTCRVLAQVGTGYSVDAALPTNGTETVPVRISGMTISLAETAPAYTGAATAGGTTTLTSSSSDFVAAGVQAGWKVTNTTTTSTGGGIVSAVTATALTISALTGGTPANITSGDEFSVAPLTAISLHNHNVRSASIPTGNNCQHQPGVGGREGYDQPRIIGRHGGVVTAYDMQEALRGTDYDWERAALVANANDAWYWSQTLTINGAGTAGYRLAVTQRGKPTGKAGALSMGSDGAMRRMLPMERVSDGAGPLTIILT